MYKSLSTSALGITGSQSELIELVLTYGFRGMDLNVVELASRAKLRGMPYARRLMDSAHVRLTSFNLPLELDSPEETFQKELPRLETWADAAAQVGCTRCLTILQPAGDSLPYHENFELHRRRLGDVCRALDPKGIRLGVGFRAAANLRREKAFQFIHEMDALGLLVNMVGAPNIGVVLDVWDVFVAGGSLDTIRGLKADQIVLVQVADAPEEKPLGELTDEERLLPGQTGRLDVAGVLKALAEMGYEGPVVPMPHRRALPTSRRDAVVKSVGEAMDQVWRAAGLSPQARPAAPV
ncbi:MAG: sugar phosphate isomerase/epimerase [Pirellulales bacterium]|nr:sugar phosphate isomerase/epimerase [Pirellulales bacterium]